VNKVAVELRTTLRRSIVQYYVALKLSAGAVAPMFDLHLEDQPAPIVRRYRQPGYAHWDAREVVSMGATSAIVTLPIDQSRSHLEQLIGKN
jgi:hypothetical protein